MALLRLCFLAWKCWLRDFQVCGNQAVFKRVRLMLIEALAAVRHQERPAMLAAALEASAQEGLGGTPEDELGEQSGADAASAWQPTMAEREALMDQLERMMAAMRPPAAVTAPPAASGTSEPLLERAHAPEEVQPTLPDYCSVS